MIRIGPSIRPKFFGSGAAPYVGLLDTYTGAAAAYSLRLLRSAYTGSAIRVRRSSDNTEQDIGFDISGNLNQSALTTFVGSGNGFVTTWYDQSGNAQNATQSTAANQPQIVSSGNILLRKGKPSIFSSSTNFFNISAINYTNFSHFCVTENNGASTTRRITGASAGNSSVVRYIINNRLEITDNTKILVTSPINSVPVDLNVVSAIANTTNSIISINGNTTISTIIRNSTVLSQLFATNGALITEPLNSYCSEFITYTTNQSSNITGIESNINSYYGIY